MRSEFSINWQIHLTLDTINISPNLTANLRIEAEDGMLIAW
jgi:hypothetical protein